MRPFTLGPYKPISLNIPSTIAAAVVVDIVVDVDVVVEKWRLVPLEHGFPSKR